MEGKDSIDIFCSALEMKQRKRELYENAMKACPDQVGMETFRMLRDAESMSIQKMEKVYEELKKGSVSADSCRMTAFEGEDRRDFIRSIAAEQKKVSKACSDDVAAIESGLKLEDASMRLLGGQLKSSSDPLLREFLQRLIAEEREHYIMLADLKFYYLDTGNWFLEKGKQTLDGAGAAA
ncbi:MAG: hypothetical protein GX443_11050 [Deltaproteobacteria bacterium]|nr:hypothetical protein [Deltaproteobacteria bacterium]